MHLGVNTLFHVPDDIGGTETYLREILQSFTTECQGLRITVFTHYDNDQVMRDWLGIRPNITYCLIPIGARNRPLRIMAEQVLLPFYAKSSGVELLWSAGYTAPYFSKCPQVVTIHDLQYKKYPQDMGWFERIVFDRLVRIACKQCSGIITVSEFSRQEIVHHRFSPPEKIHVVLEGVSTLFGKSIEIDSVVPEQASVARFNDPFILCVAHTYPHKNVDLLVRAFGKLADEIPHNLVLVGKPRRGEAEVERAIQQVSPGNRLIRLMSGVSLDMLRLLYQKADIFVLPSVYEGFGLPILEAMMAETPVICPREASLPEVGGQYVHYVRSLSESVLATKIVAVLNISSEERKKRMTRGREWAERFSWQGTAEQTITVMRSCLS